MLVANCQESGRSAPEEPNSGSERLEWGGGGRLAREKTSDATAAMLFEIVTDKLNLKAARMTDQVRIAVSGS